MNEEEWYVILNMNCKYEICRMCPKSGLFKGSYEECEKWIEQKKRGEMQDRLSNLVVRPIEKIKKRCLCCGNEMELFLYEDKDFCDRCYIIVCKEVFNKENGDLTIKEVRERIKRKLKSD